MSAADPVVAVLSPGDMGHRVGALLRANGVRVITQLGGRSARTRGLAEAAGIEDVGDDAALVRAADLLLSILVPAEAPVLATRLGRALEATGAALTYVDCNAIAPQTAVAIGAEVEAAGARFVDAGIIGPPPKPGAVNTRFYASGEHAAAFARLGDFGLDVRVIGARAGDASAVKMCYAALTKGTTALMTQLAIAAKRLGVSEPLAEEFAHSQPAMLERMRRQVPAMVPKAHRWVGEMEEIAKTFAGTGLTPLTFEGAAELYAMIADSSLGHLSPEEWAAEPREFGPVLDELASARR